MRLILYVCYSKLDTHDLSKLVIITLHVLLLLITTVKIYIFEKEIVHIFLVIQTLVLLQHKNGLCLK